MEGFFSSLGFYCVCAFIYSWFDFICVGEGEGERRWVGEGEGERRWVGEGEGERRWVGEGDG